MALVAGEAVTFWTHINQRPHDLLTGNEKLGDVKMTPWFWLEQFSLGVQSCLTLCDPMDCSMPSLAVHHQLPELTHTHVHHVGDVIQLSHPLLSHSSPAFSLSQHQGLF